MSRLVVLDTSPLGMVTNPKDSSESRECKEWLKGLLEAGVQVAIPAIADYELRRELLRERKIKGIERLDALSQRVGYLDIRGTTLEVAAELWAEARIAGIPTAHDKAIDGDMILTAQARMVIEGGFDAVIATSNVSHLARFGFAKLWQDIGTNPLEPLER